MAKYPTDSEHYFLLEEDDVEVEADCGCRLTDEEDGVVRLYQCTMHAAAEELLEALVWALRQGIKHTAGPSFDEAFEMTQEILRKARGQSQ